MKHAKQFRALIALLLCLCMILALGACKVSDSDDEPKKTKKTKATTTEVTEPDPSDTDVTSDSTKETSAGTSLTTEATTPAPITEDTTASSPVEGNNSFGRAIGGMMHDGLSDIELPGVEGLLQPIAEDPEALLNNRYVYAWINSKLGIAGMPEIIANTISDATLEAEVYTDDKGTLYASLGTEFANLDNADFDGEILAQDGTLYFTLPDYCDYILKTALPDMSELAGELEAETGALVAPNVLENIDPDALNRILENAADLLGEVFETAFSAIPDSACKEIGTVDVLIGSDNPQSGKTVTATQTEIEFTSEVLLQMVVSSLKCLRDSDLTEKIGTDLSAIVEQITGENADAGELLNNIRSSIDNLLDQCTPDFFDMGDISMIMTVTADADGVYEISLTMFDDTTSATITYTNTIYDGNGRFTFSIQFAEDTGTAIDYLLDLYAYINDGECDFGVKFDAEEVSAELDITTFTEADSFESHTYISLVQGEEHMNGNIDLYVEADGDDLSIELVLTGLDLFVGGQQLLDGSLDLYFEISENTDSLEFNLDDAVDVEEFMNNEELSNDFTNRLMENDLFSFLLIGE